MEKRREGFWIFTLKTLSPWMSDITAYAIIAYSIIAYTNTVYATSN